MRYVSDWSRLIYETLRSKVEQGLEGGLQSRTKIHMIDPAKKKFVEIGAGEVSLTREQFHIQGQIYGKPVDLTVPITNIPTLPFGPGKYLEVQSGEYIYRCVLEDGRLAMKFINLVKIFHELSQVTV